ncbi:MOSC domain-containing protein [Actinomadura flavalba]|uniref:MOSC domain-containing protein n=1 Tax=Actinomadura flavalba TaxID=1120938 RepID=UPI00037A539B|nr:MOSC domain-containing protein [Actinomadura flavalba]
MKIAATWRYPVKSMLGESLDAAEVTPAGVGGDRARALVDLETGRVASAKNPRLWRDLLRMRPAGDGIVLPDGTFVDDDLDDHLSEALGRRVTLASTPPDGAVLDRAVPDQVLAEGIEARVATEDTHLPPNAFVDFAPVHLITTATLATIGAATQAGSVDPLRYRPNLVIDVPGEGHPEASWADRELEIGDVVLRVIAQTPRCAVPTLEHGDLPRDTDALRVPAKQNRVAPMDGMTPQPCAGAYATVVHPGTIRAGDDVRFR